MDAPRPNTVASLPLSYRESMDVERAKKILVRQRHDTSIQSAAFVHYGMLDLSPETLSHPIMKKNLDTIRRAVRQGQGERQGDVPPDVRHLGPDRRPVAAFCHLACPARAVDSVNFAVAKGLPPRILQEPQKVEIFQQTIYF